MAGPVQKAAERLISLTHNLAALLLAFASFLVVYQVFTRFVIGHSAGWSEVAARGTVIWMVFMAAGVGFRIGAMISLEFIRGVLPPGPRNILMWVVTGLTLLFLGILAWYGLQMTLRVQNQRIAMLGVSMSWFYAAIPIGCLLAIPGVLLAHFAPVKRNEEEIIE
ncbi:TRAP transporter small permease [Paracoccus sp. SCSIO 75233]|uniref:TRAP transporter small permease n=1 Tax=Paracoccus sp. SCSIO 75233 TaxID=3017782 RepID=UPI0022F08CA3|nr:TRAP transporter small permease [Paracoccus sp. SCSIO 75233]WBU52643.1 TRAP transporter small permease [Paracoccus sp. SCSIO 75233]